MTFVVQGEILMDGSDAKSELQRLRAEQAKVVSSTDKANQSSTRWGRTVSGVRTACRSASPMGMCHLTAAPR